jgi:hypothetical protein
MGAFRPKREDPVSAIPMLITKAFESGVTRFIHNGVTLFLILIHLKVKVTTQSYYNHDDDD